MSTIRNSFEYYESNQSLLSMLNNKKGGNALINQIIKDNETAYQKKMESMGVYSDSKNNKYFSINKTTTNLIFSIDELKKESLYNIEEKETYDKTQLIKCVNNFASAFNNEISNLRACGGALDKNICLRA